MTRKEEHDLLAIAVKNAWDLAATKPNIGPEDAMRYFMNEMVGALAQIDPGFDAAAFRALAERGPAANMGGPK